MNVRKAETRIGLIGAGLLGGAIAERLRRRGATVVGYDTDASRREVLAGLGALACERADEVFSACELVILSLPTSDIVSDMLAQNASTIRRGSTIIDTTTGEPEQTALVGLSLHQQGVDYIEANVAGSSDQLREGRGALLIGGKRSTYEKLQPVLKWIVDKHFFVGPVGAASRFKLVHNLLLGLHRAVLAEGLSFAESLGFNPAATLEILQQTPAASAVMDVKGPKMVSVDYVPQARLSQHLKDVRLILSESERCGAKTPLSAIHLALLEQAEQLGFGEADNSAIIEVFRSQAERGGS